MRGYQRWVWWPKWAPASIRFCIGTTGAAIVFLLPVSPLKGKNRGIRGGWTRHRYVRLPCGMGGPLAGLARKSKREGGTGLVWSGFDAGDMTWLTSTGRHRLFHRHPELVSGRSEEHTSELQSLM